MWGKRTSRSRLPVPRMEQRAVLGSGSTVGEQGKMATGLSTDQVECVEALFPAAADQRNRSNVGRKLRGGGAHEDHVPKMTAVSPFPSPHATISLLQWRRRVPRAYGAAPARCRTARAAHDVA